ncbi:hypothetical protein, partial [Pseudomonas coronafaciens]|uniref:hypothetical protein n=1 Tax=Pseudomonas coronafaciens TaxID=53409 RepID=UPI000F3C6D02
TFQTNPRKHLGGDNHPETGGTIGMLYVDRPHTLAVVKLLRGVFADLFVEVVTVLDRKTSPHKAPSCNFAERMPYSARIVVYGVEATYQNHNIIF